VSLSSETRELITIPLILPDSVQAKRKVEVVSIPRLPHGEFVRWKRGIWFIVLSTKLPEPFNE